ncbi:Siderophore-interacting FAD-binding domain protein [Acetobacteraceae bacterium AT-5844]|nr:Siderophore-interacting FAD-binding domain protein [Acetobacteraceae bacterium AT-5844]
MTTETPTRRTAQRVRHELRFRLLTVLRVEQPTPGLRRITLGGEALAGFISAAHDDHVKLFFPAPGEVAPRLPTVSAEGTLVPPEGGRPIARDYTPRRFTETELEIDFVQHGDGPAATWSAQAKPGDLLGVGGPRGSFVVPDDFDWYLLVGDETALPAIARRLAELPASARAIVLAEIPDASEEQPLPSAAEVTLHWVHRGAAEAGDPAPLSAALAALSLPEGEGYAWIAAESDVAKSLRRQLLEARPMDKSAIKAAGYWKRGAIATHDTHSD